MNGRLTYEQAMTLILNLNRRVRALEQELADCEAQRDYLLMERSAKQDEKVAA